MKSTIRWTTILTFALLSSAVPIEAQSPGGCAFIGQSHASMDTDIYWVSTDGATQRHLLHLPNADPAGDLAPAPGNDGLVFAARTTAASPGLKLFHLDRDTNRLSTLAALGAPWAKITAIVVDQSGDLLLSVRSASTIPPTPLAAAILRYRSGGGLSTTVPSCPAICAMEQDPATGRLYLAGCDMNLYRMTPSGGTILVRKLAFPSMPPGGLIDANMHTVFSDGSIIVAWHDHIFRVDPATTSVTTLVFTKEYKTWRGLDHDPVTGDFYRSEFDALKRYDPITSRTTHLASLSKFTVSGLAARDAQILTGAGPARPGAAYPIRLRVPDEPHRAYHAAASLGTRLGIPCRAGRIPLDPDPLFFLSLTNPFLFSRFAGVLDGSGAASLAVNIPMIPGLRGHRFFVAALTFGPGGVSRISEPLGATIQ